MSQPETGGRAAPLSARLLGRTEIFLGGRPIPAGAWPGRAPRSLLLLLLGTQGHRLARDQVLDALWPDAAPGAALNALYKAVHALRRTLEPDLRDAKASAYVQIGGEAVWLAPGAGVEVDADAFQRAVARSASLPPAERRSALRAALALYGGDFLEEEPYADWPVPRREALRGLRERAALDLASLDLEAGEPLLAVPALDALLGADPTAEEPHRALMRAFAAAGQRDRALRQFERCREVLERDLGAEPAPETLALRDAIARAPATKIDEPRAAASRFDVLPVAPTPLIGREREVDELQALFWRDDVRLVTLTGPGGIGKTRLALAVAWALREDFPDGIVFVSLVPLSDPTLVESTIAQTMGIREVAGRPIGETLRATLAKRNLLLVIDNFEHLLSAAPVVADLLAACPSLKVLATSREALRLRGEHERDVRPLALPNPDRLPAHQALSRYGAVALFRQAIQAVRPEFEITQANAAAVAEICLRLDGLPLAIELAAARCRHLSPGALLARLGRPLDVLTGGPRDAPARQRTLREAIAWSYDLLEANERALFRRLAVFSGGFTTELVERLGEETVKVNGQTSAAPGELLGSLLDKSLISRETAADQPRFRMLETIREFALERLVEAGEDTAARQAHAAAFLSFVEGLRADLFGPGQAAAYDALEQEIDNLRAAMSWAIARGDAALALRLTGSCWRFWLVRGRFSEGRSWLEQALELASEGDPTVDARIGACRLATSQGDHDGAVRHGTAGLAAARALGDPRLITGALAELSIAVRNQGRLDEAARLTDEALAIHRATGNEWGVADSLMVQGQIASMRSDLDRATQLYRESLAVFRRLGDQRAISSAVLNLAVAEFCRCEFARSIALYEEGLAIARTLNDRPRITVTLANLGFTLRFTGDLARGIELATESLRLAEADGHTYGAGLACYVLGDLRLAAGDLRSAVAHLRRGLVLLHEVNDWTELINCLEATIGAADAYQRSVEVARLLGAAAGARVTLGSPLLPWQAPAIATLEASARCALGDKAFGAAWEEGTAMTLDDAVATAVAFADEMLAE